MLDDTGRVKRGTNVPDSIIRAVLDWLDLPANREWLAVYDNYNDPEVFTIRNFIPPNYKGRIIITSRRRNCARLGQGVELGSLSIPVSLELLLHGCQMFYGVIDKEGNNPSFA